MNLLPRQLESEYVQYHHYFDHWNIQMEDGKTNFFLLGKWKFQIDGELNAEEILRHMNLFEWIYKGAFEAGVNETQLKIKITLGIPC